MQMTLPAELYRDPKAYGREREAVFAAEGFDPREFGLYPVRLETWRGFVFVNVDQKAGPLAELVAPLDPLFEARGVATATGTLRRSHELACNWKTYVENYLEGYHIGMVHPQLASNLDAGIYQAGVLSPRHEDGVAWFQSRIAQAHA